MSEFTAASGGEAGVEACVPPPLPPLPQVLGQDEDERLLALLRQETFRQRGEGFRSEWAFHRMAVSEGLGAPLARSARIASGGKEYALQPFARDTLFNEVPRWGEVQRLSDVLGGAIPATGVAREVLAAAFASSGAPLHPEYLSHQRAVQWRLGPALGEAHRITVGGTQYSLQVFAGDTLYCVVGQWQDLRRLSELAGDTAQAALRDALWAEACAPAGVAYDPASPFQQAAMAANLGAPLSAPFQVALDETPYQVQVFALDTLFAPVAGGAVRRMSELGATAPAPQPAPAPAPQPAPQPGTSGPADALSDRQPSFGVLPVPGQPRVSQFYGYTKWSAGGGRQYYGATQGMHSGIDFAVPVGTPLLSVGYGVVLFAGENGPFGARLPQSIVVRYGSLYVLYGHASVVGVRPGQAVVPGQELGRSGEFGGPHLHFEVRPVRPDLLGNTDPNQRPVNPGYCLNAIEFFSADLQPYFERQLAILGGVRQHFCTGGLHDQPRIVFGQAVNNAPCAG